MLCYVIRFVFQTQANGAISFYLHALRDHGLCRVERLEWNTTATPARDKAWHSISIPLWKAHCKPSCIARREHKSREFRVTKLLTLVKGFSKDLVSVRTAQAIRCKKIVIHLNGTGYPFEKGISSLGTTIHSRKIVIRSRSNGSGCPLEKCHLSSNGSSYPFKTIVIRATVPNHFQPSC